jgi:hypothetical protein
MGITSLIPFHGMLVEALRGGHVVIAGMSIAHIISNQRQVHQQLLVGVWVPGQRLHETHGGGDARPIHTDILEIIGIAAVSFSELGVDGGGVDCVYAGHWGLVGTLLEVDVTCAPGAHGHVQLVHGVGEELLETIPALCGEPMRREGGREGEKGRFGLIR